MLLVDLLTLTLPTSWSATNVWHSVCLLAASTLLFCRFGFWLFCYWIVSISQLLFLLDHLQFAKLWQCWPFFVLFISWPLRWISWLLTILLLQFIKKTIHFDSKDHVWSQYRSNCDKSNSNKTQWFVLWFSSLSAEYQWCITDYDVLTECVSALPVCVSGVYTRGEYWSERGVY